MNEQNTIYSPTRTLNKLRSLGQYGDTGERLGKGAYGEVYIRNDVAVKSSYKKKDTGLNPSSEREISILINLKHINIVPILDVFITEYKINIVLEKADQTLKQFIDTHHATQDYIRMVKIYSYQLIRAIAYCHSNGIIHRDIKPQNILLFGQDLLKLADFGMARSGLPIHIYGKYDPFSDPVLTTEVATFWYRSPELFLGIKRYSYSLDNWSVGCVIAEMINKKVIFMAYDDMSMLRKMFKLLGTPDNKSWPGVEHYPHYDRAVVKKDLKLNIFKELGTDRKSNVVNNKPKIQNKEYNIPLIRGLLTLDPYARLTSYEALNSDFFDDIRIYVDNKYLCKPIINPQCHEIMLLREELIMNKINPYIDAKSRWIMLSWLYNVKIHFKLTTRTFYLTVHILDKYISIVPNITLKDYLIISAGALSLACDYEEINVMPVKELIGVADDLPTKAELIEIKENIWNTLIGRAHV